ncbi:MAG: magnesium transporter [Patescibacteria group bacterium]|nr:magnesium transporter [Patescibacteria group bacterium]
MNKKNNKDQKEKYYPATSAARVMTTRIPKVDINSTISDVEKIMFSKMGEFETINYVYIVDKNNKLKGVITVKDVFRVPKNELVKNIMKTNLITASCHTDQEKIAFLAIDHNLKAIPVVDKNNHLLGAVPSDVILSILHTEATEDILHFAGIHGTKDTARNIIKASAKVHFQKRLPWLVFGLLGGIVAAVVVGFFEKALQSQLILAAFIPAVVYMADAVGTQTQTIFIRSMALDHNLNLKKYIIREAMVGFFMALILGIIILFISFIFWHSATISFIIGISIFITILVAMIIAILLPWIFSKLKYDPAIASGPLATVFRDILSLLIYLSIANAVLGLV